MNNIYFGEKFGAAAFAPKDKVVVCGSNKQGTRQATVVSPDVIPDRDGSEPIEVQFEGENIPDFREAKNLTYSDDLSDAQMRFVVAAALAGY